MWSEIGHTILAKWQPGMLIGILLGMQQFFSFSGRKKMSADMNSRFDALEKTFREESERTRAEIRRVLK